jgi:hypothetical protein
MSDRTVHAYTDEWEIVRYDRAGKWYAEWVGIEAHPVFVVGTDHRTFVNSQGRAPLTVSTAAMCAKRLEATINYERPGGRTFDRLVAS